MKRILTMAGIKKYIFGIFLLAIVASSCKKSHNNVVAEGNVKIKVVHAVEGAAPQDFYSNDAKLSPVSIAYGESSAYLDGNSGNNTYKFTNSGSQTANASVTTSISTGTNVTAFYFVSNTSGQTAVGFLVDDLTLPAAGKAKVLFVNLGVNLLTGVNASYANGNPILNSLTFASISNYLSVDPNVDLSLSLSGSTNVTTLPGSLIQAGKIYTIWFDGSSSTSLKYHIIVNN